MSDTLLPVTTDPTHRSEMTTASERIPGPCPCCGGYSLPGTTQASALLAVSDVLVVKALEQVGRRVVHGGPRSRRGQWAGRPFHLAHTMWPPDPVLIDRSLSGAWDVVPAMLDLHGYGDVTGRAVVDVLDEYVRDLLVSGTAHGMGDLRYRFETRLGIHAPERAGATA